MSTAVAILGESGAGKSTSMRNLDPSKTLLIQAIKKPLPFKPEGWKYWDGSSGNIFATDKCGEIEQLMKGTKKKVIVIDDFQYVLSNELMRRWREGGYTKFSETGFNGWSILTLAGQLPDDVRVYITAHTMRGEDGNIKFKTPGKLLESYSVEGMFSIVLRSVVRDGEYYFATRNSGDDTVKTPMGMFAEDLIPNDIALVDQAIIDFGWAPSASAVIKV